MVNKADLVHGQTYYQRHTGIPSRVITTQLYTIRTNTKRPAYEPSEMHVKSACKEPSKKLAHGYLMLEFAGGVPGPEGLAALKAFPVETLIGPDFELLEDKVPSEFRIGFTTWLMNLLGPYEAVVRQKRAEADAEAEVRTVARTQYNHLVKLANELLGGEPLPEFTHVYSDVPGTFVLTLPQLRRLIEAAPAHR